MQEAHRHQWSTFLQEVRHSFDRQGQPSALPPFARRARPRSAPAKARSSTPKNPAKGSERRRCVPRGELLGSPTGPKAKKAPPHPAKRLTPRPSAGRPRAWREPQPQRAVMNEFPVLTSALCGRSASWCAGCSRERNLESRRPHHPPPRPPLRPSAKARNVAHKNAPDEPQPEKDLVALGPATTPAPITPLPSPPGLPRPRNRRLPPIALHFD